MVTRRLTQLSAVCLVVAYAFPHDPRGMRVGAIVVAAVGLMVLAFGLVLRPVISGVRRQRRDEQRDWPFG